MLSGSRLRARLPLPPLMLSTIGMLIVLILLSVVLLFVYPIKENGLDFQAFYCAGKSIVQHANPYLNQPMHDCERAGSPAFFKLYPNVTVPAPLPPYALAFFTPFALLPYVLAKSLWWALLFGSVALIAWLISKLSGLPLAVCCAASVVAVAGPSIPQLALAPIPIALLCLTAYFVIRERWNAAAACAVVAMIEPHVTLPADVALFLFVPALRWRLAGGAVALAALSFAMLGAHTVVWYFTTVLPEHAVSEVNNAGQFSLTTLLYHFGISPAGAVRLGSIQYALMFVLGIWAGYKLARAFANDAYLVFAPAAFSVVGGTFIHLSEVAIVIPFLCLLTAKVRSPLPWTLLIVLSAPWESVFNWWFLAPFSALGIVWLFWYKWKPLPLLLFLGAIVLVLIDFRLHLIAVEAFLASHSTSMHIAAAAPGASADVTWQAFNKVELTGPLWWSGKVATLVPLALMTFFAFDAASRKPRLENFLA